MSLSNEYAWYFEGDNQERAQFLPWKLGQPNGLDVERCVVLDLMVGTYEDVSCSEKHCTLCAFEKQQKFSIRGVDKTMSYKNNRLIIDRDYVFLPMRHKKADKFKLRGYLYSDITWSVFEDRWQIQNSDTKDALAFPKKEDETIAIGKMKWNVLFGNTSDLTATLDMKLPQV